MTISNEHDLIEMAPLTPGERFQNWLALQGIGESVRERSLYQPEPPPGLWMWINGATAIATVIGAGYVLWQVIAHGVPALLHIAV